ncbi:MAG: A/G-specific adenine glycosylase [Acidimicrobiales bacterium]
MSSGTSDPPGSTRARRPVAVRDPVQVRGIGRAIERWGTALGGGSRRPELPWRSTRDPWAVLVSEVMAQQTQLARVVAVYLRFLDEFPTAAACAAAPLGDVLRAWHGLGYNRRARNLHGAAAAVVADHGGVVPSRLGALLALPGVGPYTARAVLAFAYCADVGVVDTNTGRVLSRAVAGRPLRAVEAQDLVDAMVPPGCGWTFGQALLDLGASVCVAGTPRCGQCPVRRRCRWAARGLDGPDPARGSSGVSTSQPAFSGSDREGRGRLVATLRAGPIDEEELARATGWADDPGRAERIVEALLGEGIIAREPDGTVRLP